jgi:hypothetical protein
MGLLDILTQAVSANTGGQHLDQVIQQAPPDVLGKGLSEAFKSDQTPPIGNMVSQLFGQSNGSQQAGMLNQMIGLLGPTVIAGLAGGALGKIMAPGQTQITPEQAQKLTPQQVEAVVNQAHQTNPAVADNLGQFYAQHSGLIKTLGGIAATVAMMKMKDHLSGK